MIALLLYVVSVCTEYNCSVTSWIRTEDRNEAVGGVPNSKHLNGLAVDVVFDNEEEQLEASKKVPKNIKWLMYPTHVHIEVLDE